METHLGMQCTCGWVRRAPFALVRPGGRLEGLLLGDIGGAHTVLCGSDAEVRYPVEIPDAPEPSDGEVDAAVVMVRVALAERRRIAVGLAEAAARLGVIVPPAPAPLPPPRAARGGGA